MIDYQVYDYIYRDSCSFKTLEEAREYIARQVEDFCVSELDFAIFKRERIEG
jgi:hypothetical protein